MNTKLLNELTDNNKNFKWILFYVFKINSIINNKSKVRNLKRKLRSYIIYSSQNEIISSSFWIT